MKAKDIVTQEVARQAEFGYEPSWEDFVIAGRMSWMKEVVEWIEINNRVTPQVNENRGANIPREVWQAKLKEWGIK